MSDCSIALILGVVAITTPLHWGLLHESIHGNLIHNARWNGILGRLLSVPLLMSWEILRFGHLTHHDDNRNLLDRPEVLPEGAGPLSSAWVYYAKLLGGHALLSALAPLGMLLPFSVTSWIINRVTLDPEPELSKIRASALKIFSNAGRKLRIRVDFVATGSLLLMAIVCWGAWWPVFVGTLAVRFCLLSLVDNSHHYGTSLNSGHQALNTNFPRRFAWTILNHNFHGMHHVDPKLNWLQLGAAARTTPPMMAGNWFACIFRQFRGQVRADQIERLTANRSAP